MSQSEKVTSDISRSPPLPNLYLTVTCPSSGRPTAPQLMALLKECGTVARLKRYDDSPQALDASFLVDFGDVQKLDTFVQRLRQLHPEVSVSCLDDGATGA